MSEGSSFVDRLDVTPRERAIPGFVLMGGTESWSCHSLRGRKLWVDEVRGQGQLSVTSNRILSRTEKEAIPNLSMPQRAWRRSNQEPAAVAGPVL